MRLVKYVRVSTEESAAKENSISFQSEYLDRWAKLHGHEIVATYEDNGYTAMDLTRPGLNKMLAEVSGLQVDGVLIYTMSRLVRDKIDYAIISLELGEKRVHNIVSATQNFDHTPEGQLMEGLSVIMAQYQRENIRRWCMNGMDYKARNGGWPGGQAPFGYRLSKRELEIHPVYGPVVATMFDKYVAAIPIREIRTWLENITGRAWVNRSLYRIFLNPRYLGLAWWKGKLYRGKHPPLVTLATWRKAVELSGGTGGQLPSYGARMIIPLDTIVKAVAKFGLE